MSEAFVPHSHKPYGADGSGFYADNTLGCFNVVQAATPLVLDNIVKVPYNGKSSFTICDYGTADGGVSMFLMKDCIERLKKTYGEQTEVHIVYEDQPYNDFKSLFLRMHGLIKGPPTYINTNSGVYITACGTGFYDQCLPSNSVHFGFASTAMHWLRKRPSNLTDAVHHTIAPVKEEVAAFAAQSAADWEHNLLLRAKELAPGGRLTIVNLGRDNEDHYLGKSQHVRESMFFHMNDIWSQMRDEGHITQTEFQNTTINNYYRNEEETSAPLTDPESPVYKAGLRLVSIETKIVRCPYHIKWMEEGKKDDVDAMHAHAKWYVPTTRTWSNSSFMSGLSDTRCQAEKEALVDQLFQRYEARVAAAPEDHAMDYVHVYVCIEKVVT